LRLKPLPPSVFGLKTACFWLILAQMGLNGLKMALNSGYLGHLSQISLLNGWILNHIATFGAINY